MCFDKSLALWFYIYMEVGELHLHSTVHTINIFHTSRLLSVSDNYVAWFSYFDFFLAYVKRKFWVRKHFWLCSNVWSLLQHQIS